MRVRLGVDVGGTFTHAVAVAQDRVEVIASTVVPTTHDAAEGVAAGVLASLEKLLEEAGLEPGQVTRVAHSTTQATNALLEGDVSPVGVLAVGSGWEGRRAGGETDLGAVELAPGRSLLVHHRYLEDPEDAAVEAALDELLAAGAEALVVATAFSVDDRSGEEALLERTRARGVPATATHEVSGLYGLRMRTRTAAVNAAILPRMLATAEHTEAAVRRMGIEAPLVVMRSDGGAMDLGEMKRRPLLTLLSGPAAGVAAALMAVGVSDGIFLEVGGTSSDVSCFVHGRPRVRAARVGDHRIFLETLDVRAVGVAGGSMVRVDGAGGVVGVGPRSAHIAGLAYAAFSPPEGAEEATRMAPREGDPIEYLALACEGTPRRAVTPSCAATALGQVEEGSWEDSVEAFAACAGLAGGDGKALAAEVMRVGGGPIEQAVRDLIAEYRLPKEGARLVAGGGGGAVWGPEIAGRVDLPYELAPHAPVISAVGAALALLQETVERSVMDPTPEVLRELRREAEARVVAAGAAPETVEVRVEADAVRGIVRAVALGAHDLDAAGHEVLDEARLLERAAGFFGAAAAAPVVAARAEGLVAIASETTTKRFFGLWSETRRPWRVLDTRGRVRLGAAHGEVLTTQAGRAAADLGMAMDRLARWGDAGRQLPGVHLLARGRVVDLTGIPSLEGRVAVLEAEVTRLNEDEAAVLAVDLGGVS